MTLISETPCPCGSQNFYEECCKAYIEKNKKAPTAETLMRSRYTAYVLQNSEYLLKTWYPKKRPPAIDFSKESAEWLRLEIISVQKGGIKDQRGLVEFQACYRIEDKEHVMKEISRFKRERGAWFYLDGNVKSISANNGSTNQGLNAPCSCGSGKKFKRCCGKKQS